MHPVPVQLVLQGPPPRPLLEALGAAGLRHQEVALTDAAEAVSRGAARLVVCARVPGWQALIARVESAGGGCVLWGPPPSPEDHRQILPANLEAVQDAPQLVQALARAEARLWEQRHGDETNEELLERARSAERISKFAHSIASQIELPGVIREAMARARALCDACGASLLLVDSETGELCFDTVVGAASEGIERVRLKAGQGIAGKVAQTARPMLVRDAHRNPDFSSQCDEKTGFLTGSIVAVPMLLSGDVLGVLEAVRREGRPNFDEVNLRHLADLAPHVTIAVHNAQMTDRLKKTQAEVLEANRDLEKKVNERTAQIARAKEEWELTFDSISEPIALQEGFTLKRTNIAYAKRVGLAVTQLPGKTCHQVLAGRETPCPGCPLTRPRGAELAGEVHFGNSAFEFSGFWLSGNEQSRAVVVHYRDITEQRVLQARLRESERMASLGQLASGAAHEINNPLGFVTSNLSSLQACLKEVRAGLAESLDPDLEALFEDGGAMIDESLSGAQRVGEIVRALRELSRLELDGGGPACANASVTRAARTEFGEGAKNVDWVLEATEQAAIPPLQLDQVLGQILRNAHQAVTGDQRILIRTASDEREVRIAVHDEGRGIPPENLHRIFEPFFTTRGVGKGVGLGLTAAYGIARRHSGEIEVQSEQGQGSTFTVRLPRALLPASPIKARG